MPATSKTKTAKKRALAAHRQRAWAERHASDRWRTTLALVRSVGANIDRERVSVSPSLTLTRTVYIGGALLAMESLTPSERLAFVERYAELHARPAADTGGTP